VTVELFQAAHLSLDTLLVSTGHAVQKLPLHACARAALHKASPPVFLSSRWRFDNAAAQLLCDLEIV
jgi:hypothetical protein